MSQLSRLCECCARAAIAGAALGAQHQRHGQLAAGHEMRLRGAVDELVERERDEVDEHDLEHRAHARLRRADRDAGDRRLADRRVDHALGAELLRQAGGRGVGPALGDVLPEDEHALVGAHRVGQRRGDRLDVGRLSHRRRPSPRSARPAGTGSRARSAPPARPPRRPRTRSPPARPRRTSPAASPWRWSRRIGSFACHSASAIASRYLAGIALVVAAQPVRQALEEERAAACARRGEVAPERIPHRERRRCRRRWRARRS